MDSSLQNRKSHHVQPRLRHRGYTNRLPGNVAFRAGYKLQWNASRLKATNSPQTMNCIRTGYRSGWEH
jgi:hypothetical protein